MATGGDPTNYLPNQHRLAYFDDGAHRLVGGPKLPVSDGDDRPLSHHAGKDDGARADGPDLLAGFGC